MSSLTGYFFLWDCDGTLLERTQKGLKETLSPRQGINPILGLGQQNVVVSSRKSGFVRDDLKRNGLERYFGLIYGSELYDPRGGKEYQHAADHYHITPSEASRRMIIIGDGYNDAAKDLDRMVFIQDYMGEHDDAGYIKDVVDSLLTAGDGSFADGYYALMVRATRTTWSQGGSSGVTILYSVTGNISLSFEEETTSDKITQCRLRVCRGK